MKKIFLTKIEASDLEFYLSCADLSNILNKEMYEYIKYNSKLRFAEYRYNLENDIGTYFDVESLEWIMPKADYSIILSNSRRELIVELLEKLVKESVAEAEEEEFIKEIKDMILKFDYTAEELEYEHPF